MKERGTRHRRVRERGAGRHGTNSHAANAEEGLGSFPQTRRNGGKMSCGVRGLVSSCRREPAVVVGAWSAVRRASPREPGRACATLATFLYRRRDGPGRTVLVHASRRNRARSGSQRAPCGPSLVSPATPPSVL